MDITARVAQLWCLPKHENKVMDSDFAESIIALVTEAHAAGVAQAESISAITWRKKFEEAEAKLSALTAENKRMREALDIARELHQMFSFPAHPGYPARKAGFLRESEWLEMGKKLAALSPEPEKPAPKKLSDHLPGCAYLATHDKDCDCSPAPSDRGDEGRKI